MLTIDLLRQAYDTGFFPMAEGSENGAPIYWFNPRKRAVFFPDRFHIPKRLARLIRQDQFEVRWNEEFKTVMQECASLRNEDESWISPEIIDLYTPWHEAGEAFCLSVFQDGLRVGGIYGVQRGGVFMAESMFSRVPNASSVALVWLVAGLTSAGIEMIDVQFENPHLKKFEPALITKAAYQKRLRELIYKEVVLSADHFFLAGVISFIHSLSQTS